MSEQSRANSRSGVPAIEPVVEGKRDAAANPPLRVLIVAPSLDILGGQSRQARRLIDGLRNEPSVAVSFLPHNPRLPGPLAGIKRIKYIRTIFTSIWYWAMLLYRVPRFDIIHVFSASYFSYLLSVMPALGIARLFGKKALLNYRSGEAEDHLRRWRRTARPTMRLANAIVVPSGYLVDVFGRFGLTARAIANTVEQEQFTFRERRPLRPIFLSTRLLEPLYNVGCILRAFAIIQRRFPEAKLIVAGEGSQRAELEKLSRDLGLTNVEFVGAVAFEEMPALYDSADIYLNTPDLDNMPSSLIECSASGLLIVTTNAGGIPYILTNGETGLMVPVGDAEGLAASAICLLDNEALASSIALAARKSSLKYSWGSVKTQWLSLYEELVRPGKSQPVKSSRVGGVTHALKPITCDTSEESTNAGL